MQSVPFLLHPTDTTPPPIRSDVGGHAPSQDAHGGDLVSHDSFSSHLDRESENDCVGWSPDTGDQAAPIGDEEKSPAGFADDAQEAPDSDEGVAPGSTGADAPSIADESPHDVEADSLVIDDASNMPAPQTLVTQSVVNEPVRVAGSADTSAGPGGTSDSSPDRRPLEAVRAAGLPAHGEPDVPVDAADRASPRAVVGAEAMPHRDRADSRVRSERADPNARGSVDRQGSKPEQVRPEPPTPKQPATQTKRQGGASISSLASLLDEYGGSSNASNETVRQGAAVARAEQVQQAVALEQAAQLHHGARIAPGSTQALALDGAPTDARQDVLADLTARESARAALEGRTGKLAARALGALASQRGGTMTMRLDPSSIGELAVRMTVLDGTVRAEMTASTSAARLLIERSIDILRSSLESRGLRVDRLSVQGPGSGTEAASLRSEAQQQGGQSNGSGGARDDQADDGRRDAAGRESRGRGGEQRGERGDDAGGDSRSFRETMEQD